MPTGLLSAKTLTVRQARRQRYQVERPSLIIRWLLFRKRCAATAAFWIAATIPVLVLLGGVILHLLGAGTTDADQEELPGVFLSTAEVLGAVAALMFAVLVFAVEFQIGRAGNLAPLTKFLHRSSGMMPDGAFVISVIATAVVLSFWVGNDGIGHGNFFEISLLVLVLVALGLTLWHFCRVINDSTSDLFGQLQQAILPYVGEIGDEDKSASSLVAEFESLCASHGIEVKRFAFVAHSLSKSESLQFMLEGQGSIADVKVAAFEALARYLRVECSQFVPRICLLPTDSVRTGPCLVLEPRAEKDMATPEVVARDKQGGLAAGGAEVTGSVDHDQVDSLLNNAFVVGQSPLASARELGGAVEVLVQVCEDEARSGRVAILTRHFEILESLVREWSTKHGASATLFAIAEDGPRWFPTTIGSALSDVVHAGIQRDDQEVFDAIEVFLHRLVHIAEETGEDGLAQESIRLLVAMYPITLRKQETKQNA